MKTWVTVRQVGLIWLMLLVSVSVSAGFFTDSVEQAQPLPAEQAFVMHREPGLAGGSLRLHWEIAKGYYLYRQRITLTPQGPIKVTGRQDSAAQWKEDPLFGKVEVYHQQADVTLQLHSTQHVPADGQLTVSYQGCWEGGICYPPQTQTVALQAVPVAAALPAEPLPTSAIETVRSQPERASEALSGVVRPAPGSAAQVSEQDRFARILAGGNWWLTCAAFFVAGLALSLTPCVFPMIPIISSIIAGQGRQVTTARAVLLSLVYVLAVAVTYTCAGLVAGLLGENLQIALQNPWVIGSFSLIFVVLALSMFGFYELQLPTRWQSRFSQASGHQQGGTLAGVAVMGLLSALIIGPCMAAPLAGALIYIGQTGDPVLGAVALFSLSVGMGVPILLVGASAGKLLPKAGAWMDSVKAGFGVLLLLMAIWMLDRVVPTQVSLALAAGVIIIAAVYLGALEGLPAHASGWQRFWKGCGLIALLYGVALLVGVLAGSNSVLQPLKSLAGGVAAQTVTVPAYSASVVTPAQLQVQLAQAKAQGQPVLLDFYADWCVSCKEVEAVLQDARVSQALAPLRVIKVDVTANDQSARQLSHDYQVIGPPALLFIDHHGQLRTAMTLIGPPTVDGLIAHVRPLLGGVKAPGGA